MFRIIFIGLMLIVSQKILSQVQPIDSSYITLTGLVKDAKHNPIAFATVSLAEQKTSTILHTTITDSLGQFSFITKPNNRYKIIITAVGFTDTTLYNINSNTTISVSTIILSQKDNILSSVVISAQKPVLEKKIDRLVFNISSNMALGNTALDILTKAPGVVLLPNETITLLGKKGVQIFINDRPSKMDSKDLMALLKSLAADDVKQIEIITNPSARYDAQGVSGIINIVLKRGYAEGYKLRLYKNYGQGTYHKYNAGSQLSYSTKKWSVFGNYGYQNQINREDNIINRSFTISNNTSKFNQYNCAKIDYNTHTARAGIDYSINNKSTISALFIGSFYKEAIPQQNTTYLRNQSSNTIDSSFINHNVSNNKRNDLSFNLNFFTKLDSMQSSFSTDIDYAAFSIGSLVDYNTYFYNKTAVLKDSLLLKSNTPINVSILSGKFDIVKIWKHDYKIEVGFKGSMVNNKSNVDFSIFKNGNYKSDSLRSNRFDYQESIHAGYVNLSKSFEKISIQLGMRGEKTYTQGKSITLNNIVKGNYFNLFPSAFVSYDLVSAKHQLSFSYSRRIERPYYQDLNPFIYFVDPYTSIQGNPFLLPQYTNAFELSYTFKSKYLFSGFFNQTSDVITPISIQNDTTKTTITKTGNLSNARQWGITINAPFTILKIWQCNTNVVLYKKNYFSNINNISLNNNRSTVEFTANNSIKLPYKYILECTGMYISPFVQGIYKTDALYTIAAAIKRKFLSDALSIKLSVEDIFRTYKTHSYIQFQNQNTDIQQQFDTRIIRLSMSYNFKKGKFNASRDRKGSSEEEQKRVK